MPQTASRRGSAPTTSGTPFSSTASRASLSLAGASAGPRRQVIARSTSTSGIRILSDVCVKSTRPMICGRQSPSCRRGVRPAPYFHGHQDEGHHPTSSLTQSRDQCFKDPKSALERLQALRELSGSRAAVDLVVEFMLARAAGEVGDGTHSQGLSRPYYAFG